VTHSVEGSPLALLFFRAEFLSYNDGMDLSKKISASKYLETSTITGEGVNRVFQVF
jgi:hypothetical protein